MYVHKKGDEVKEKKAIKTESQRSGRVTRQLLARVPQRQSCLERKNVVWVEGKCQDQGMDLGTSVQL